MYIGDFQSFLNTLNDIKNALSSAGIDLDGCCIEQYSGRYPVGYDFQIFKNDVKVAEFSNGYFRTI